MSQKVINIFWTADAWLIFTQSGTICATAHCLLFACHWKFWAIALADRVNISTVAHEVSCVHTTRGATRWLVSSKDPDCDWPTCGQCATHSRREERNGLYCNNKNNFYTHWVLYLKWPVEFMFILSMLLA